MSAFRSFFTLLCAAGLAHAQNASSPPSSIPSAHAHTEPVTLDHFVISASPFARNQIELAQSTTVLSGRALLLKQQPTLGETLAGEPGIGATSFGPGASRPIIRGLGGDRIRLLENSVGTIDASVTSPDHAVSIEPFLIERIEVLRGPASLLYGSSAVGGVVNVLTHRIETDLPAERVRGRGEVRFGGAADELARGGMLDLALHHAADRALVLHLDGFRRSTENLRIPGFAESARLRATETEEAEEHGEPAPLFTRGRLRNSALDSEGGAVGLSFVSPALSFGGSYNGFDTNYGVPGHTHEDDPATAIFPAGAAEGVRIDLRQRRADFQGEWRTPTGLISGLKFKLGRGDYRHTEREPEGTPGTVFTNRGHDARLELLHGENKTASGAIGVQFTRSDFAAAGEEAFLPPSLTRSSAVFAFQEIARGPLTWQFGARLERTRIQAQGAARRSETDPSGSLGAIWKLDEAHTLALSIAHTERAANTQELHAYGPHAGTHSFEIGDATLGTEKSLGLELSLRRRAGAVTGTATIFTHRFRGYIFERPTGLLAVEHDGEWEFVTADDDEAAHGGGLPVYRSAQSDARFWGAELEALWHLHESAARQLDLRLAADFTRGREEGGNLPRIPAARVTLGVLWAAGAWHAGAETQFVFDQTRVAASESTSASHALASAHVGYAWSVGRATWEFFVRGTNLANEEARPHPSFVKDLAPLPARAVSAGVRVAF